MLFLKVLGVLHPQPQPSPIEGEVGASSGLSLVLSSMPAQTESITTTNQQEATKKTENRQSAVCLLCFLCSLLFLISLLLGRSARGKKVEVLLMNVLLGRGIRSRSGPGAK